MQFARPGRGSRPGSPSHPHPRPDAAARPRVLSSGKPAIIPACVEPVTEHTTMVSKKTPSSRSCSRDLHRPAREPVAAERMVTEAPAGNRVGLAAGREHVREHLFPALLDADAELRPDQPHVRTSKPAYQDVADLVVDEVRPGDPALLDEHELQTGIGGYGRDLAGVVGLDAADRHERVATLRQCVGDQVLQLAPLCCRRRRFPSSCPRASPRPRRRPDASSSGQAAGWATGRTGAASGGSRRGTRAGTPTVASIARHG